MPSCKAPCRLRYLSGKPSLNYDYGPQVKWSTTVELPCTFLHSEATLKSRYLSYLFDWMQTRLSKAFQHLDVSQSSFTLTNIMLIMSEPIRIIQTELFHQKIQRCASHEVLMWNVPQLTWYWLVYTKQLVQEHNSPSCNVSEGSQATLADPFIRSPSHLDGYGAHSLNYFPYLLAPQDFPWQ